MIKLVEFEIKSEVSDEEYQIDTIWDVTVEEQVGVVWWQQVMDFLEKKNEIPKQS